MLFLSIPVVLALSTFSHGLLVVPSSPQCADTCGNVLTSTSGSEMTCHDADYATSQYGATFKACVACELNSTYYDTQSKFSDLQYAIYNMRFALSWCLFGWENNTAIASTPCLTGFSCQPLQSAFEYDSLNPNASSYSYCPLMMGTSVSIPKCSACLAEMGNENYLANYVTVLEAACIQQPVQGKSLSLAGNVFSSQVVNITTPSATPISYYNGASSGLTLGSKIGIAVGAVVVLLALSGFCIVWTGKRRRRRVLAEKARATGYEWQKRHGSTMHTSPLETAHTNPTMMGAAAMGQQQFFDSPQSQRPLFSTNAWGQVHPTESPVSGHPDSGHPGFEKAYFSPYSSQYTSPVSATDALASRSQAWPRDLKVEPEDERGERIEMGDVQGGNGNGGGYGDKKDASQFEITPVGGGGAQQWQAPQPPILGHPGHGRGMGRGDLV